jgi:hypothetical protein
MSKRAGSTVVEVKGSRAVYVSQPQAVASLIEKAAKERSGGSIDARTLDKSRNTQLSGLGVTKDRIKHESYG